MMGRLVVLSPFCGLLHLHHICRTFFNGSFGPYWANAYKLGLCSFVDDSVHGCHESIGIEYGIFST